MNEEGVSRIDELVKLRAELAADYAALNAFRNDVYNQHLAELEQIRDKKIRELEEWRENEIQAAETYYSGQCYAIGNDYEEKLKDIEDRLQEFLAFKIKALREHFPLAAAYFESNGYYWPLQKSRVNCPLHLLPEEAEIRLSDEPLISPQVAEEDVRSIQKIMNPKFDGRKLLKGLGPGQSMILQMPNVPPIVGKIGKILDDQFEFKVDNNLLKISLKYIALHPEVVAPKE
jgi:hypothetical protein